MSFPTFPRKRKTCAPSPPRSPAMSVRQRQPRAPRQVLSAMESAPGCFPYPSTSLTRVPNTEAGRVPCGSRPRPARNPRRRSPPRITPAPGGWRGRGLGPARPAAPARRGAKRGGVPAPAGLPRPSIAGKVPPGPGVPEPRAPALGAVTCSPSAATGAGRAGSRCERRERAGPGRGTQAFPLRELKLGLQGCGKEHPLSPQHPASKLSFLQQ